MSSEFTGALTIQMDNTAQMDRLFYYLPLDIIAQLMTYLSIDDWGRLDVAFLYNHTDERRGRWLQVLRLLAINVKVESSSLWSVRIDKGVLKWLIARGIKVTSWENWDVNVQQLMAIANGLPMLQVLNISYNNNMLDAGVIALANGILTDLATLDISGCRNISDAGVIALANGNLISLTELDISGCRNISDAGVIALANGNLISLTELDIHGCRSITDAGISALANGNLTKLTTLIFSECDFITDAGVIALANGNLTSLTSLDISWCDEITDAGVIALATSTLLKLCKLDIDGCTNTSDAGLVTLANGNLKALSLLGISQVTNKRRKRKYRRVPKNDTAPSPFDLIIDETNRHLFARIYDFDLDADP